MVHGPCSASKGLGCWVPMTEALRTLLGCHLKYPPHAIHFCSVSHDVIREIDMANEERQRITE